MNNLRTVLSSYNLLQVVNLFGLRHLGFHVAAHLEYTRRPNHYVRSGRNRNRNSKFRSESVHYSRSIVILAKFRSLGSDWFRSERNKFRSLIPIV